MPESLLKGYLGRGGALVQGCAASAKPSPALVMPCPMRCNSSRSPGTSTLRRWRKGGVRPTSTLREAQISAQRDHRASSGLAGRPRRVTGLGAPGYWVTWPAPRSSRRTSFWWRKAAFACVSRYGAAGKPSSRVAPLGVAQAVSDVRRRRCPASPHPDGCVDQSSSLQIIISTALVF